MQGHFSLFRGDVGRSVGQRFWGSRSVALAEESSQFVHFGRVIAGNDLHRVCFVWYGKGFGGESETYISTFRGEVALRFLSPPLKRETSLGRRAGLLSLPGGGMAALRMCSCERHDIRCARCLHKGNFLYHVANEVFWLTHSRTRIAIARDMCAALRASKTGQQRQNNDTTTPALVHEVNGCCREHNTRSGMIDRLGRLSQNMRASRLDGTVPTWRLNIQA